MLPDSFINAMDTLLTTNYPADGPGAAAIVIKDGKVLFRNGAGLANLEWCNPIDPETVFKVGSVTKQFTAVAILMLAEQGKLDLRDPIEKHLTGYPTHGHTITIEHLLTHTSGIVSYTDLPEWFQILGVDYTVEKMIENFKYKPMSFAPGTRWSYNNSAYFLLGAIIEKVSGLAYDAFLQERIFAPLDMRSSVGNPGQRILPKRASGYDQGPDGWVNAPYLSNTHPGGAGVIHSTIDDLAKWDAALYTEKLVSQESLRRAWTPYTLLDGSSTHYGFGWMIDEREGAPWIHHSGGIFGFVCQVIRVPSERLFAAVLSNCTSAPKMPGELAFRMAHLALGKPLAEPQPVELPVEQLERLAGVYKFDHGDERAVEIQDGKLILRMLEGDFRIEMIPLSAMEFAPARSPLHRLRFLYDASGQVTGAQDVNEYGRIMDKAVKK